MQREYKNMSLTHNRACLAPLWLKDVMVYSTTHFVRPFLLYVFDSSLVLASNHNVLPFILSLSFMHTHTRCFYMVQGQVKTFVLLFIRVSYIFACTQWNILYKDLKGLARIYSRKNCICTGQSYKLEICFCYMMIYSVLSDG